MFVHCNSNAEFRISFLLASSTPKTRVFLRSTHERIYGAFMWGSRPLFPVDGILTRKRLTNFFRMGWSGQNILEQTMQAFDVLSCCARRTALKFKIFTPFMEIRHARGLLSRAIDHAVKIMGHDSDQAEKLMLHSLAHDTELQAALNRVCLAMLMRDIGYSPIIAKHKIVEMQAAMNDLHSKFSRYRAVNRLPYCELTRDICCEISMVKDHLKDARKAVA